MAGALYAAGWQLPLIPVMLAIARAESGCDPNAVHGTSSERSVGPLQINVLAHRWISEDCARSFLCSALAAKRIYAARGLPAWSAYRNGAYLRWLRWRH